MIHLFIGCWAPEMAPPTPAGSTPVGSTPTASSAVAEQQAFNASIPSNEQRELDTQARTPPYTAWTIEPSVPIVGPNGNNIIMLPNRGTRVEVLKIVPGYAQVICSGCLPPKQNQAGWISIEQIALEWDLADGDPLLTMLSYRRDWLRNKDTPAELSDRSSICMLFNSGYTTRGDNIEWKQFGGHITFSLKKAGWKFLRAQSPTEMPKASWRCDIQYPKAQKEKLP